MNEFWLCFVPLFVAVDPIGILPIFLGLTSQIPPARVHLIILESLLTATLVSLAFLAGGLWIMEMLGITVGDFMIAGGILLFALSVTDILTPEKAGVRTQVDNLGAVPLGVPLIAGPAVLTTVVLLLSQYGFWPTALALISNMGITGAFLWSSRQVIRFLGRPGTTIMSKIASMLLSAISVMMVRKGLLQVVAGQ